MEIHTEGSDLLHVDGQTYTTKLTVAFSKFVNANNNSAVAGIYIVICVTAWN